MHIITLTSDWNENDYYVASIKGKLLSGSSELQLVDINHRIKAFDSKEAAFVIRNAYPNFPEGTIHIIAVNTEPEKGRMLLAARKDGQYFLCADNGILTQLGGSEPELVVGLEEKEKGGTFRSMSVLSDAALALASGTRLEKLGSPLEDYLRPAGIRPVIGEGSINGKVIHIDSYQNAITNISEELFERVGQGSPFEILVQSRHYRITELSQAYNEVEEGDLVALFNSAGLLEIAIRSGNAAGLLNLSTDSSIRVEFKNVKNA